MFCRSNDRIQNNITKTNAESTDKNDFHDVTEPLHKTSTNEDEVEIKGGRKGGYEPSLVKTLARAFGATFMVAAFFKFCVDCLTFVNPQILK